MKKYLAIALVLLCGFGSTAVQSQVKMERQFVASKSCPALFSIKKGNNPGNVSVEPGTAYALRGKNREAASHYWIVVPDAEPRERWVQIDCGQVDGSSAATPEVPEKSASQNPTPAQGKSVSRGAFYVLALSWQPTFCEGLPGKAECRSQKPDRADAKQFSLHGLWPQPRRNEFCNVSKSIIALDDAHRWEDLPEPELKRATRDALAKVMPGMQSLLERHEWIKHGTCYPGSSAETYFADAVRLTTAINASAVGRFVLAKAGKRIQSSDLRAQFDAAFGAGAGDRVRVACKPDGNRQLIAEITIGLKGDISAGTPIDQLIAASSPTDPGCPGGILDPAGLQ